MASSDQQRWDGRYAGATVGRPVRFVVESLEALPTTTNGRALDIAGGTGGTSLLLAERGLDVTLLDLSPVALAIAGDEARRRGLDLDLVQADLDVESLPDGPFDLVVCANYLNRSVLQKVSSVLAPGGLLLVVIATVTNLERNEHPSRRFLVEPGELPGLVEGVRPLSYGEGWFDNRHEARFIGTR